MSDARTPGPSRPGDGSRRRALRDDIARRLDRPSDDVLREPSRRDSRRGRPGRRLTVAEVLRQLEEPADRVADAVPSEVSEPGRVDDSERTETIPPVSDRDAPPGRAHTDSASNSARHSGGGHRKRRGPATVAPSDGRIADTARRVRRRRSATTAGRVVVVLACVLALVGTGFVWGYLRVFNGDLRTIAAINGNDKNIRDKAAQTGDQTYLIVGTDTRAGQNGRVGAGTTSDADGARSDTVILVNIPANRSRVVAVSFPRDLQIDRPQCKKWDNNTATYTNEVVPAETGAKLNTAYGDGGPQCAVQAIQQISGLNINHFIAMDFFGFEQVVNKLGGVQVCSPVPLYDYELGQVLPRAGKQLVRGSRALNYVRARTIESEGNGDYGRIKRQQLFMSSLLRSMLSSQVLSNPARLTGVIRTFNAYSRVDGVTTDDLLNLAQSLEGLQAGRVTFLTVPTSGTTTDGSNNEIPRTDDINAIFDAIINDEPLPGEQKATSAQSKTSTSSGSPSSESSSSSSTAPTPVSAAALSASSVAVRVLNATGTTGLATRVSDSLSQLGFEVRGVADASQNQSATVVRYGPGQEAAAATVASMITGAVIQPDRTVKAGVELLLGSDYPGRLGSVPDQGTSLTVTQNAASAQTVELPSDLSVTNGADTSCES